jgi:hypothetical protein
MTKIANGQRKGLVIDYSLIGDYLVFGAWLLVIFDITALLI